MPSQDDARIDSLWDTILITDKSSTSLAAPISYRFHLDDLPQHDSLSFFKPIVILYIDLLNPLTTTDSLRLQESVNSEDPAASDHLIALYAFWRTLNHSRFLFTHIISMNDTLLASLLESGPDCSPPGMLYQDNQCTPFSTIPHFITPSTPRRVACHRYGRLDSGDQCLVLCFHSLSHPLRQGMRLPTHQPTTL